MPKVDQIYKYGMQATDDRSKGRVVLHLGRFRSTVAGGDLPFIRAFIPTDSILEIAPGFGLCTNFLKHWVSYLMIIDLAENCIKGCQQRFSTDLRIPYYVNDRKSLAIVPNSSIDFVFRFDSLVHAQADAIEVT